MVLSTAPAVVLAGDTVQSVNVNLTAQAEGAFLCAPQFNASVSSNTAESYGFTDSITDGVSAVDALVRLHEIKFGDAFTKDTAKNYLVLDASGYISKLFAVETTASGFTYNGAVPNDGTESTWGGYNGTTVTTQEISDGDTVEFFMYQDTKGWSDELAWLNCDGNDVTEITLAPKASVKLNLKTFPYMMGYEYIDADAIHAVGSTVSGAQLAWVDTETGNLEAIASAVTNSNGDVSITMPEAEGTYYLTAYIPDNAEGEPLIMSLTKVMVSADTLQTNTAPIAAKESDSGEITLGDTYSVDLSEIFTDADEADTLSYKVSINDTEEVLAEEVYTFTPDEAGEYKLVFTANDGTADSPAYTVSLSVKPGMHKPESITIEHDASNVIDGKVIIKKGDKFKLTAYDENGAETPVIWKNTSYGGGGVAIDENTGEIEVTSDVYSGGTSYLYFTATSALDESVTKKITIQATGYMLNAYQKSQTVALSADGQTAKTASLTAGFNGHNIWSFDIPEGVAELKEEAGNKNSVKFNVYRPGTFTASFKLDINEAITDTASFTVTGVAVEDNEGSRGKTYLGVSTENQNPTVQLTAYAAEGRTISSWESADENIATVDENGLVTAKGIGSTIITATDSEGAKGGIKAVIESEEIPYFESLEFAATAFNSGTWVKDSTFAPTKTEYDLPIKNYSTSSLMLQASTLYDTDKYTAVAEYTDVYGENQSIAVNSGKATTLANQPFDSSVMTITLSDKNNAEKKTVYTFNVSRPRDTSKEIKRNGITLTPGGRDLSQTAYNGVAEGTMRKADENGNLTSGTGVSGTQNYYRTFIYDTAEGFKLKLSSSTAYAHIRYSTDGGSEWKETEQGGGVTDTITLPETGVSEIIIRIIDDDAYAENIKAGKDGFFEAEPNEYKLWVDRVTLSSPKMLTAEVTGGDWYPSFSPDLYSYWVVTGHDEAAPVLTYTTTEGCTVKIGAAEQIPDADGKYTLELGTSQKSITVTSEDGNFTNTYKFAYKKKSALDVPDKVVDYLCMGSQYTNAGYGINPEQTLGGSFKSLGNFGGYITYYYENPITDNPNNKYGMDFYVIGNSMESNIDSMAELGQVYVSEDGNTWYALAGSEHYEDKAIWDYTITYTKGEDGKAYWTDNQGNSIDYTAKNWPGAAFYYMNNAASSDTYTFTGIVFKSQLGSIMGDSTSTGSFAASARFGYADYYASNLSGVKLTDVNSYVENPSKANGFDVAWAVDESGTPIDVSDKKFHYIKVATASNIYAGGFAEKSTEVAYVVRTTPQEAEVGKTGAPAGVTISDGADSKTVSFTEDQSVYPVNLDSMKYVSVAVNGTADDDNIYVNNQRVASGSAAEGFKVTKENGETLVRVIVQSGDKEPVIYLLKLTSSATESNELIESIKINASGTVREASTKNGTQYSASVGHRIGSISIAPVTGPDVKLTVNGGEPLDSYELSYGVNTFEITAEAADGKRETITLTVTRDSAPVSGGKNITVSFTLYGDEKHGASEVHTYKNDKSKLPVWISQKSFTVDSGAAVIDVFEKALTEAGLTWKNGDGNYITEIDGLAEFSNGSLSGWLYTLNGKYPGLGVAEQTLRNGDKIVFHYTDDYTQEQGSEKWTSSSGGGSSSGSYTVKFETNGGSAVKSQSLNKNGVVKEPSAPSRDGYVFEGWYTDRELTKKYDFAAKVTRSFTLYAKWTEDTKKPANTDKALTSFTDVEAGSWYEEAVSYAAENNLFKGVSETEFVPGGSMTRAMLVTVLYRLENEPDAGTSSFADVESGSYYEKAVAWAGENGIVKGISDTEFAPDANVTREQIAAIIYRYADFKGIEAAHGEQSKTVYDDNDKISDWAADAAAFCSAAGIMIGNDKNEFNPQGFATRAEVAKIFMVLSGKVKD